MFVFLKGKTIKKGWKITIIAAALIMAVLAGGYLLLQNSAVQTYIIGKITEQLSRRTNSKISIGKVDFTFFNPFTKYIRSKLLC